MGCVLIQIRLFTHSVHSTHEQLQEKAHEKDIQIQNLLRQFDQLKAEQKIRHWVEKANVNEAGIQPGTLYSYTPSCVY